VAKILEGAELVHEMRHESDIGSIRKIPYLAVTIDHLPNTLMSPLPFLSVGSIEHQPNDVV
jgi:hypothetical protein